MKRNLQALALAAILYGTQAAANDAFPAGSDEWHTVPATETYSDRHAAEGASSPATNVFPLGPGRYRVPAMETHVDRHRNDPVKASGSPFPASTGSAMSE